MQDQNTFTLFMNSRQFKIPFHFENLVHINIDIFNSLIVSHHYHVQSITDEQTFQSFLDFLVNKKEPEITSDNIPDYTQLSHEFQFSALEDLIQMKTIEKDDSNLFIDVNIIKNTTDKTRSFLEEKVAENLDDYLLFHGEELIKQPIEILLRIFTHPKRKLINHNLVYDLIYDYFFFAEKPEIFQIFQTLDGNELVEEKLNEIIKNRSSQGNMLPKIDPLDLLSKIDKTNENHTKIFKLLCFNKIETHEQFKNIETELFEACQNEDIELIEWLTQKEIEDESGMSFKINQTEKTAAVFRHLKNIENVFIPHSIKYNNEEFIVTAILSPFNEDKNIKTIQFDKNSEVRTIGKYAFKNSSIESISIPSKVVKIDKCAFAKCEHLKSVEFQESSELQFIGELAFNCSSIESITIPSKVTQISNFAFSECTNLKTVEIIESSNSITIESRAFYSSSIEKLKISSKFVQLKFWLFYQCNKLKTIEFSENTESISIEDCALFDSSIESINIFSSKLELGDGQWCQGAYNLKDIIISPSNKHYQYKDDRYFLGKSDQLSDNYDVLIFCKRDIEAAIIPSNIKFLSPYSFAYCSQLKAVEFSEDSELLSIGSGTFYKSAIENISIPSHVETIGYNALEYCLNLKSVKLNSNLISIKCNAFGNSAIERIDISSSNVEFNEGWLCDANHLNEIIVSPSNSHFIYKDNQMLLGKTNSFNDNYDVIVFTRRNIKEITIPSNIIVISRYSLAECFYLKSIKFAEKSDLNLIEANAFRDSSIENILIPLHVSEIGCYAFSNCDNLKTIEFHENSELKIIGKCAFRYTSINSFVIPASVSIIGEEAFAKINEIQIIEISEKSQLHKIDISWFDNDSEYIVMTPAKMFDEKH